MSRQVDHRLREALPASTGKGVRMVNQGHKQTRPRLLVKAAKSATGGRMNELSLLHPFPIPARGYTMAKNMNHWTAAAAITAKQIKLIHALKTALHLDSNPAHWHEILYTRFSVISSKELNISQAGEIIDEMQAKALELGLWEKREDKRERFNTLGERPDMASPQQLRKIEAMWQEISRAPEGPERSAALRSYIMKIARVQDLRWLTAEGAGKVINALNAMNKSKGKK